MRSFIAMTLGIAVGASSIAQADRDALDDLLDGAAPPISPEPQLRLPPTPLDITLALTQRLQLRPGPLYPQPAYRVHYDLKTNKATIEGSFRGPPVEYLNHGNGEPLPVGDFPTKYGR
jgi:hypothetical protein